MIEGMLIDACDKVVADERLMENRMQTGESLSEITVFPAENQGGGFVCRSCSLIREVPETRRIYSAQWQGQSVIVKVFYRKHSAQRHMMREWEALKKLSALQVACPEPLFYGQTDGGQSAVVTGVIPDAQDMFELFTGMTEEEKKFQLLQSVIVHLAHLHIRGVEQRDLHLGNFLLASGQIYLLDPAQIHFYNGPLPLDKGLCQLALLCSCWPADAEEQIELLIRKYFAARGLPLSARTTAQIQKMVRVQRQKCIRQMLKKSLRDSKRYMTYADGLLRGMFVRQFWTPELAAQTAGQLDELMKGGKILKRGNTCFVSLVEINGQKVVIKRYNHKGTWHSFRQTVKGSRARRCWMHGLRFASLNIPTAGPLAFIEKMQGPLVYCSYILNEYAEGQHLGNYLKDNSHSDQEQMELLNRVDAILLIMEQYNITHGDMKLANIIITANGPVLIDLDSVTVHRTGLFFRRAMAKDIEQLSQLASA